jgi:predicted ATP-dependent Lon-type protease
MKKSFISSLIGRNKTKKHITKHCCPDKIYFVPMGQCCLNATIFLSREIGILSLWDCSIWDRIPIFRDRI